jgi:hypothetical protein
MSTAVFAATLALREGSNGYRVGITDVETFRLPALDLTTAHLGEDAAEEVVVMAEKAPGWLPAGIRLPVPDPHGLVEAVGVRFCG